MQMNWVVSLVCRSQYSEPLNDGDSRCQTPEIQSLVSSYSAVCTFVSGLFGLYMLPRISKASDRVGRKFVFGIFFAGDILASLCKLVLLNIWTVDYRLAIIPYTIVGLFGSSSLITIMMSSYTSDCVRPVDRPKAMSYVTACQLVGKAVGPFASGRLVQATGSIGATLMASLVLSSIALTILTVFAPESRFTTDIEQRRPDAPLQDEVDDQRRESDTQERGSRGALLQQVNILHPIKSIWRIAKQEPAQAYRNIIGLICIDLMYEMIINARAGIAVLYPQMKFAWTSVQVGYLQSATACMRIVLLVAIIPQIMRLLRYLFREDRSYRGISRTEIAIVRGGNVLEVLGYSGYGLATTAGQFIASSFVATSGVIAKPFVQSSLLNLVPKQRIAEFLGAKGVLDGLFGILFSSIGLQIYSYTVSWKPELLFFLSAGGYFCVILLTTMISP